MHRLKSITTTLIITLLLSFTGLASATLNVNLKTASGVENLAAGEYQQKSVFKRLIDQGKIDFSYDDVSGSPLATKRIPSGKAFPDRPLPRDTHGNPIPETNAPHTQLGTRTGRKGTYPQAREFDGNGNPVRDIDFTNHGRANHPNPHQHQYIPNATGGTPKRGPTEPLQYP